MATSFDQYQREMVREKFAIPHPHCKIRVWRRKKEEEDIMKVKINQARDNWPICKFKTHWNKLE